jgi:FkbM family methyltransferase
MDVRALVKRWLRQAGVELQRYVPQTSDSAKLGKLFATHQVDCVFDVGANVGQYAEWLRGLGYGGRVVSFEPLAAAYSQLLSRKRHDDMWVIAPRMALGDFDGISEINVSENLASSSLLRMEEAHLRAAPTSRIVGREEVKVARLDSVFSLWVGTARRPFLKIDTQGYEAPVLRGARDCLRYFVGVQAELSLCELYRGQELFFDVSNRLRSSGFDLVK